VLRSLFVREKKFFASFESLRKELRVFKTFSV
jgi:hypothetical protein